MSGLRGWLKRFLNTPSDEAEQKARELDSEMDGPMSLSMGILENICLDAHERNRSIAVIRESGPDVAAVFYRSGEMDEKVGELPMESAHMVVGKIRSLGNVNGWASLDQPQDVFELTPLGYRINVEVAHFQLKPSLLVELRIRNLENAKS